MQLGEREVVTQGLRPAVFQDLYHFFMTVSWPRLFATIAAFYLAFDVLFGCLYYLVPGCIANLNPLASLARSSSASKRWGRSVTVRCIRKLSMATSSP